MKILVVDDSPIDRRLASSLLTKAGYTTSLAENGQEALAALEKERADLVLTDLQMPEMDGLTLVDEVRKRHTNVPVILMTAHGSEDLAVRALQHGAASYVPKRDLARSLAETVKSVLSIRSAPAEAPPDSSPTMEITRWELGNDLAEITPVVSLLEMRLARFAIDDTSRIQVSVALREAIVNAMLHGNLELASSLKEEDPDAHDKLAAERRTQDAYKDRKVRVTVTETNEAVSYMISDDGAGFDLTSVRDPLDLENLERTSGRGLFLIRTFMDEVKHTNGGKTITMVKRRQP